MKSFATLKTRFETEAQGNSTIYLSLAKNIAIINKLRYFVDLHTLKQLYYSFIYPYLSYATIAWGSACKTSLRRILTKQNKCVRSMFFAHSKDSATPYYNLLGILKFENVYKLKVA